MRQPHDFWKLKMVFWIVSRRVGSTFSHSSFYILKLWKSTKSQVSVMRVVYPGMYDVTRSQLVNVVSTAHFHIFRGRWFVIEQFCLNLCFLFEPWYTFKELGLPKDYFCMHCTGVQIADFIGGGGIHSGGWVSVDKRPTVFAWIRTNMIY